MSFDEQLATFVMIVVPSYSGSSGRIFLCTSVEDSCRGASPVYIFFDCTSLKIKASRSFETSDSPNDRVLRLRILESFHL